MAKLKITAEEARGCAVKSDAKVQKILDVVSEQIRQKAIDGETRLIIPIERLGYEDNNTAVFSSVIFEIAAQGFVVGTYSDLTAIGYAKKVIINWKELK